MEISNILSEFLAVAALHILAVASPGPDFAVILRQSLRYGKKIGIYTALGIGTGIFVHIIYTLLGFSLLIKNYDWAFLALRIIGGLYLMYIGFMSLRAKAITAEEFHKSSQQISTFKAFKTGFLVNALNVKATLFFLSVYTAVVNTETPLIFQISYGIWMALATFGWFSLLSALIGNKKLRLKIMRYSHWIEKSSGVILLLLGLKLLLNL